MCVWATASGRERNPPFSSGGDFAFTNSAWLQVLFQRWCQCQGYFIDSFWSAWVREQVQERERKVSWCKFATALHLGSQNKEKRKFALLLRLCENRSNSKIKYTQSMSQSTNTQHKFVDSVAICLLKLCGWELRSHLFLSERANPLVTSVWWVKQPPVDVTAGTQHLQHLGFTHLLRLRALFALLFI